MYAQIPPTPPGRLPSSSLSPKEAEIWATRYGWVPPHRGLDNRTPLHATTPRGVSIEKFGFQWMMG